MRMVFLTILSALMFAACTDEPADSGYTLKIIPKIRTYEIVSYEPSRYAALVRNLTPNAMSRTEIWRVNPMSCVTFKPATEYNPGSKVEVEVIITKYKDGDHIVVKREVTQESLQKVFCEKARPHGPRL